MSSTTYNVVINYCRTDMPKLKVNKRVRCPKLENFLELILSELTIVHHIIVLFEESNFVALYMDTRLQFITVRPVIVGDIIYTKMNYSML
jgi:hypothetical protein